MLEAELTQLKPTPALGKLAESLSRDLPADIVRSHLVSPLLSLAGMGVKVIRTSTNGEARWLSLVVDLLCKLLVDNRPALSKDSTSAGQASRIRSNYVTYDEDYGTERGRESEDDYDDSDDDDEEDNGDDDKKEVEVRPGPSKGKLGGKNSQAKTTEKAPV